MRGQVSFSGTDDLEALYQGVRSAYPASSHMFDSDTDDEDKVEFPRFIPDDPENPHLSSSKLERARRVVINQFI